MLEDFKKIKPKNISDNVFKLIGYEWMLITAGNKEKCNPMTASWGSMGVLWNLPVAISFIRPQRYTNQIMESSEFYTISFFEQEHRPILNFCGSKSGRNTDKIKETGLLPFETESGAVAFEQSKMFFECRKLYADRLKPENFIIPELIERNYKKDDFHCIYIGEILNCYVKIKK